MINNEEAFISYLSLIKYTDESKLAKRKTRSVERIVKTME